VEWGCESCPVKQVNEYPKRMLEVVIPRSHKVLGSLVEVRTIDVSDLEELTLESFRIFRKQNAVPSVAMPYTVEPLLGNLFLSQ
jgi:hypothetical protein